MIRAQNAILPGVLFSCLVIIVISNVFTTPALNWQLFPDINSQMISNANPLSNSYPSEIQQWKTWIESSAQEYGIDSNLVAAVILQESGGNPQAYSKSGAVGLMQVMPKDGLASGFQCKNGPCFANRPSMEELFDPQFNIEYGTRMLADLISRHGNLRDALKAYGPMDVEYRYADIVLSIYENY